MRPAPLGTLTAAFESTGSPHWIMHCIQQQELDRKHGFQLRIDYRDDQVQAQRHATEAALVAGQVDFIDTDWLTIARCRQQGHAISAIYPYGRILGGLVVSPESGIQHLTDLLGKRIGVVNRLDKNWILLCAYAQRLHALDLEQGVLLQETRSKTTLKRSLEDGELDGALVYWHQLPWLEQQGFRKLADVPELLQQLLPGDGLATTPTTFFVFRDQLIAEQPALVRAFTQAFEDALGLLTADPALWRQIVGGLLSLDCPELLQRIRDYWESRMPGDWSPRAIRNLESLFNDLSGINGKPGNRCPWFPPGTFNWQFMSQDPAQTCKLSLTD